MLIVGDSRRISHIGMVVGYDTYLSLAEPLDPFRSTILGRLFFPPRNTTRNSTPTLPLKPTQHKQEVVIIPFGRH